MNIKKIILILSLYAFESFAMERNNNVQDLEQTQLMLQEILNLKDNPEIKYSDLDDNQKEIITKNINVPLDKFGNTALHLAIQFKNLNLVKILLADFSADSTLSNIQNKNCIYLLAKSLPEGLNFLIDLSKSCTTCKKANANKKCGNCERAHYCSAQCQQKDWAKHKVICKTLSGLKDTLYHKDLEKQLSEINIDLESYNLVYPALKNKHILRSFVNEIFVDAVYKFDSNLLNTLKPLMQKKYIDLNQLISCKYGSTIDKRSKDLECAHNECRETLLIKVIKSGDVSMVNFLIENGADLEAQDMSGLTALSHALMHNKDHIYDILRKKGANINAIDDDGVSILMNFIEAKLIKPVYKLIECNADLHAKDKMGMTPIMYAATYCNIEALKILIKNGANINEQDYAGNTALIHAICRYENVGKNKEIVRLLVNSGADINLENAKGTSALTFSRILRQQQIEKILLGSKK